MKVRNANILFGDIKGYSRLTSDQLKMYAKVCLPAAAKRIEDYKPFHVNTWGDGLFIASDSIEEICSIALDLRDFFRDFDFEKSSLPSLNVRLSIHHGEYHQGTDPFTSGGLLSGQTIIRAARMEPVVLPGQIWITDAAAIALRDAQSGRTTKRFGADEIGPVTLAKGAGQADIFSLRRAREARISSEEIESIQAAELLRKKGQAEGVAFEVCVGVVLRNDEVLLVRRNRDASGLDWMFPSGKMISLEDEAYVVRKEVHQETGISCVCKEKIADIESHPTTGATCHFYHLQALDSHDPVNGDPEENAEVRFVPISEVETFIRGGLTPEIKDFLGKVSGEKRKV